MCCLLCWLWWLLRCFYRRYSSIAVVRSRMKQPRYSGSCTGPTKEMTSNPDRTNCSWNRRKKQRFSRHPSLVHPRTPVRQ
uniref:Putative secreted peptide n=1 Tax=Anopheles braziliensis TaxID=58242 RepID=A0A2M3ZQ00_9DIPT